MSDANDQNTAQPMAPINCARGCGFYGNPLTENMCSKCYKETQADICPPAITVPTPEKPEPEANPNPEEPAKEMESVKVETENVKVETENAKVETENVKVETVTPSRICPQIETAKVVTGEKKGDRPPVEKRVQKNKKRCFSCKKKVGLMGFECKCNFVFCSEHRYAEAHQCTHDHMTEQRDKLSRDNPVIKADKLNRI